MPHFAYIDVRDQMLGTVRPVAALVGRVKTAGVVDAHRAVLWDCDGDCSNLLCQGVGPDCNENNIYDGCDIASGTSADVIHGGDGVPDECGACCVLDACQTSLLWRCDQLQGTFQAGVTCAVCSCNPAVCCDRLAAGSCEQDMTGCECLAAGGHPHANATDCGSGDACATGACCSATGCQDRWTSGAMDPAHCTAPGSTYIGGWECGAGGCSGNTVLYSCHSDFDCAVLGEGACNDQQAIASSPCQVSVRDATDPDTVTRPTCASTLAPDSCKEDCNANGLPDDCEGTRAYVNPAATGNGSGESWQDAYTNLEDALAAARTICPPDQIAEIWVAAGTYKPSEGTGTARTFRLPSGVEVYGGFLGFETSRFQRSPIQHQSILSGDLSGNDPTLSDNAEHVVSADGTAPGTLLDGFRITAGRAFDGGGGLFAGNDAELLIRGCIFDNNTAQNRGGAVLAEFTRTVTVDNCVFRNNSRTTGSSDKYGGAIGFSFANLVVRNSTFYSNSAGSSGGSVGGAIGGSSGNVDIANSIFWNNTAQNGAQIGQAAIAGETVFIVQYSDVAGGQAGIYLPAGMFGTLTWGSGNLNVNPMFVDAPAANLRLVSGSPCNDKGNNELFLDPPPTFDLAGAPRLSRDPQIAITGQCPIVDMGAFEVTGCCDDDPPIGGEAMNRFVSFTVPDLGATLYAIRINVEIQPSFLASQGKSLYVNSFKTGSNPVFICADDEPPFNTNYRCATLGCEPEYRQWRADLSGATNPYSNAGVVYVTGTEIVPSSEYSAYAVYEAGEPPIANLRTACWGDLTGQLFGAPDGKADVLDIPAVTNKLKDASPFFSEPRTWLKQANPSPHQDGITVIELSDVTDALQGKPYPSSREPAPCPSQVLCSGEGAVVCEDSEPCGGGPCFDPDGPGGQPGYCRDTCGRCTNPY